MIEDARRDPERAANRVCAFGPELNLYRYQDEMLAANFGTTDPQKVLAQVEEWVRRHGREHEDAAPVGAPSGSPGHHVPIVVVRRLGTAEPAEATETPSTTTELPGTEPPRAVPAQAETPHPEPSLQEVGGSRKCTRTALWTAGALAAAVAAALSLLPLHNRRTAGGRERGG
jgi:hypothetical protein